MTVCGCDLGSATGKAVLLDEDRILAAAVVRSARGPEDTASRVLKEVVKKAGICAGDVKMIVGTGYGREGVSFISRNVSEISCHAKGAFWLNPSVRTIIDIGGQDCKVIVLNDTGKVVDFQMNDKCGAGTGRFFESMCRILDCSLEQLSDWAFGSDQPASISKQCGIFAESEVISLLNRGTDPCAIAAGIHLAVAKRLFAMGNRIGMRAGLAVTGGCAKNKALVSMLEKLTGLSVCELSEDPQVTGALGAALYAREYADEGI